MTSVTITGNFDLARALPAPQNSTGTPRTHTRALGSKCSKGSLALARTACPSLLRTRLAGVLTAPRVRAPLHRTQMEAPA